MGVRACIGLCAERALSFLELGSLAVNVCLFGRRGFGESEMEGAIPRTTVSRRGLFKAALGALGAYGARHTGPARAAGPTSLLAFPGAENFLLRVRRPIRGEQQSGRARPPNGGVVRQRSHGLVGDAHGLIELAG